MEIVKGSQEYIDYINEYILPDYQIEDYIPTIDEEIIIDMLDSGEYITYDDAYVSVSMKENGYTLVIPEN
tara:strand:- start:447 stop:656 length:210 start_codon:yes stop_codon:yes gene_type:complete